MRLLVICLSLGMLLWQISLSNPLNVLTLIGFMTATGLTLTRFFKRFGLPSFAGALIGGVILGQLHIIPIKSLPLIHHLNDFAWGWAGLFLGAGITPKTLLNKRLLSGALYLYFPPTIAMLGFFTLQGTPLHTALPTALLAGTSTILLTPPNAKMTGEIIPLSKLTTALGLLLWMLFSLDATFFWQAESLQTILLDVVLFGLLLEATVQVCKRTKTEIGQHLVLISLAYLLAITTNDRAISPFFLAFPAGIFLSMRQAHTPFLRAPSLSDAILSFAVLYFALEVSLNTTSASTYAHPLTLGLYFLVLIIGKIIGGLITQRILNFPTKVWLALLPHGLVVFLCLPYIPNTIFATNGTLHPVILFSYIAFLLLYPFCNTLWSNIKRDPLAGHKPSQRVS